MQISLAHVIRIPIVFAFFLPLVLFTLVTAAPQDKLEPSFPESWSEQIEWRSIGPANMMGRITAIAVFPKDKNIWWAASASGGLLKTKNNGLTFEHQFDDQATVSIGDVQVSSTDPDLIWVGTGEANPRNSVSWGDGVYKSTDGGKTWKNMGLKKTFQTGRIAIHPDDHNIVYVGSLGRLWGPNEERGLFKTTDGGESWDKVFYVDDKTGVVDVQMNPKNPDEMLIATYERMRDGFDSNDPMKRFGSGSAIYKTVDGGNTFTRVSNGLPSCNLGRIGLCYFAKNPNYVAAIVESEKIAKEPETAAFAGLRGADAEVGAKITRITEDGPADKAGLKENDIVISVDGEILYSYNDLLAGIRKHKAGEVAKLVVSREKKPVDIAIELGKRPPPRTRKTRRPENQRTPFTGTLGGQAANMQGQQGDNEHEYGGIYLSKDSGDSWERINTLNPRPMYYSQIRFDPADRNNMYVLGTALHRSKDGGKTFTGDGGSGGIHVDHHALWIDPDDPRHMILGNDGGIYVTHDRMESWDRHNHAAIGQFYHVGVDSRLDYRIYGGLQDNGSWGGPNRVSNDSGPINSDWFRVGGGDGFVTLADPDDPDLIYFESQNGGMGRINLRTGERGFIRPKAPRGTRYRFNWKTPFILSPHNSKIHYSAGNHVFRSFNKGNSAEAISPEITNTDKGAASAITESPVKAGVVYVGTTDGAVWMTPDGGKEWVALFSKKETKSDKTDEQDNQVDQETTQPSSSDDKQVVPSGTDAEPTEPDESERKTTINGIWNGRMVADRYPEGQSPPITFSLKVNDKGEVSGEIETRRGHQEITDGSFDSESGELQIVVETERRRREFNAHVKGDSMSGEMTMRDGQFQVEFEAERQEDPKKDGGSKSTELRTLSFLTSLMTTTNTNNFDDQISGKWNAVIRSDELPGGEIEFTIDFSMDSKFGITGTIDSPRGEFDIDEGQYNPKSKKIYFTGENEEVLLDFEASLEGAKMTGDVSINDSMNADFEATMEKPAAATEMVEQADKPDGSDESPAEPKSQLPRHQKGALGVDINDSLIIEQFVADSSAEKAGLKKGDAIKSIDGQTVANRERLVELLQEKKVGDAVVINVKRDGKQSDIEVILGRFPAERNQSSNQSRRNAPVETESSDGIKTAETQTTESTADDDLVSGTWEGTTTSRQGESELKIVLKMEDPKNITGNYETTRSEGEIVEGKYDKENNSLMLVAENERFSLEFNGQLIDKSYEGEIDFNGGTFTMEFQIRKTGGPETAIQVAGDQSEDAKSEKGNTLEELLPGPRWVSSIHASKFKAERCFVSFDGHRSNDDKLYLFKSENYGKTWESIQGNLPVTAGPVRVLREDIKNENVLYLGCEFGAWVSIDQGKTWTTLKNLPTVSVHEFAQHPKIDDVVVATHGRSLWVADVSALRQFNVESLTQSPMLYQPRDVILWRRTARRGSSGTRKFVGTNPDNEARICYSLGENSRTIEIEIKNLEGRVMKRFEQPGRSKGLHTLSWDLRTDQNRRRGNRINSGDYLVEMRVDGELFRTTLTVKSDPNFPVSVTAEDENFDDWLGFGALNHQNR